MTTTAPFLAFSEADADRAHAEWGANCGPAAIAAACGLTLDAVRPHLGDFESRKYMNVLMVKAAIDSLGFSHRSIDSWPVHGVVRIQWGGPWIQDGAPQRWASCATHWIAAKSFASDSWIFDVNGGWMPRQDWERETAPLIASSIKRADGTWFATHRWEVRRGH